MTSLEHQIWIDAPIGTVYAALATAQGLGAWWAPHTSTQTPEGEVLAHSPGEAHGDVQMKVVARDVDRCIEWAIISSHPPESPASSWTGTRIRFELSRRPSPGHWMGMADDGRMLTVVEFSHEGWDANSPFIGFCNYAWGVTLDMLRQWCESAKG